MYRGGAVLLCLGGVGGLTGSDSLRAFAASRGVGSVDERRRVFDICWYEGTVVAGFEVKTSIEAFADAAVTIGSLLSSLLALSFGSVLMLSSTKRSRSWERCTSSE